MPSSPSPHFMTMSLSAFSLHPTCPFSVNGVSRLAYFNIRLGGPPGRRTNWHTWQVPGNQAAQSAAVPLLIWHLRYCDGETSVSRLSRGGVLRIVAEIFRWNFCRIVRQRTTRCREIFPTLRGRRINAGISRNVRGSIGVRESDFLYCLHSWNETETKQFQNSLKTVLKPFWTAAGIRRLCKTTVYDAVDQTLVNKHGGHMRYSFGKK